MLTPRLSWLVLAISCAIAIAYDISHPLKPLGPLGVTLDLSLALGFPDGAPGAENNEAFRNWAWSSLLTFNRPVSEITDGQLWKIVEDGYAEMQADRAQYGISERSKSNAMAVLAWGSHIILASTQKGAPSFSYGYIKTPVLEALEVCQQAWYLETGEDGKKHRAQGVCAEPMACHLYYFAETVPLNTQNARVGTVVERRRGAVEHRDPCPTPEEEGDKWGCNLFVITQGLKVLDKAIPAEAYDIKTLAGGVVNREQIQLCSVTRRTT